MATKPPPAWMVRLNVTMLRRGLKIGSQHLLTVRGRKTGLPRATPVSIAIVGDDRFVVAAFPEAAWVANIRAAGQAVLSRGKSRERVRLIELPTGERAEVIRAFLQQVPGGVRFFGSSNPDIVVASAARYPVFRVERVDSIA
jgi:deazaflavin-dependent oxidoreductase (nitroreductase family)